MDSPAKTRQPSGSGLGLNPAGDIVPGADRVDIKLAFGIEVMVKRNEGDLTGPEGGDSVLVLVGTEVEPVWGRANIVHIEPHGSNNITNAPEGQAG